MSDLQLVMVSVFAGSLLTGAVTFVACMLRAPSFDDEPIELPDDVEHLDNGKVRFR